MHPVSLPGLTARIGGNLPVGDRTACWVLDGDPAHGYDLVYDENANDDLSDDPRHAFTAAAGGDFVLALVAATAPRWLRVKGGELYRQDVAVRRGTLALPGGAMAFALVGAGGRYDQPEMFVGLDVDRDGALDLETLDSPELFHGFEREVALDANGYALAVDPRGDTLTLRPLDHAVAPRPALIAGTPAPDFVIETLDHRTVRLSALRGQLVLLDFWSMTCPPCVKALPHLAELRARWQARGFEVVGVADTSASADEVRAALAGGDHDHGVQAIDEAAQTLYRVDRFPMYFLVDRDGTIRCARCALDRIEAEVEARMAP